VEILFTLDLSPDEIERVCAEASLLYELQTCSVHVVGLAKEAYLMCFTQRRLSRLMTLSNNLINQALPDEQSAAQLRAPVPTNSFTT